ncbi:hypothetical protein GWI33_000879 [Rhynchophorus ferrugineus]|uniref:Uncharacterized protein n=1 Tax=Rhynchophorus ferrugineus TaxID=354439 RepID=A0A834ILQ3_RHYFE|nr:hypothetical protein GWI33_000879 [Rhynchophorus ferrugineus]
MPQVCEAEEWGVRYPVETGLPLSPRRLRDPGPVWSLRSRFPIGRASLRATGTGTGSRRVRANDDTRKAKGFIVSRSCPPSSPLHVPLPFLFALSSFLGFFDGRGWSFCRTGSNGAPISPTERMKESVGWGREPL